MHHVRHLVLKVTLFLLLSMYALFNVAGYRFDFEENTIRKTGVADISVYPSSASVFLDGRIVAEHTPVIVDDLDLGTHFLEIRKPGFVPLSKPIEIQEQYAAVLKNLYLVPQNPLPFLEYVGFQADQSIENESFILLVNNSAHIGWLLDKERNEVHLLDLPFSGEVKSLLTRTSQQLILETSTGVYHLNLTSREWEPIRLDTSRVSRIFLSSRNPDTLFFIEDHNLFQLSLLSGKKERILSGISGAALIDTVLLYCNLASQQSYRILLSRLQAEGSLGILKTAENFCPLERVTPVTISNALFFDGRLYVDGKIVEEGILHAGVHPTGVTAYSSLYSVYQYDNSDHKSVLITRFKDPVSGLAFGAFPHQLFVSTGNRIVLCDTANAICSDFLSLDLPVRVVWFDVSHTMLIFQAGDHLYVFHTDFWSSNNKWF